jgi:hypothetical protein
MYALNKEVVVEFKTTILTADDLNSSSLADSLIVLLMFSFMWGLGIFGILICLAQKHLQKDKIRNFNDQKIKAISRKRSSTTDINVILSKYLDEVFPVVYQTQSYFTRMVQEIFKHHRYIELLTSRGQELDVRRIITCVHLLTIQTMLMFLLAVCYELQFPTDDGTCETYQTSSSCLRESSIFDHQDHLCRWVQVNQVGGGQGQGGGDGEGYVCKYRKQTITWQATILISVLVTGFSSLGTLFIDYLFIDILSAPTAATVAAAATADSMKATAASGHGMGVTDNGIPTIRSQLSKQLMSLGQSNKERGDETQRRSSSRLIRATSTLKDSLLSETEVRILPPELIEAYTDAVNSFGQSLSDTQAQVKLKSTQRMSQRVTRLTQFQPKPQKGIHEIRKPEALVPKEEEEEEKERENGHLTSDELMTSLLMDLKEERGRIKRETERQAFDSLWGFDLLSHTSLPSSLTLSLSLPLPFPELTLSMTSNSLQVIRVP